MVASLLRAHLRGHRKAVVLTVLGVHHDDDGDFDDGDGGDGVNGIDDGDHANLVVPLDVKVGEVDGDSPLGRGDDLPDAVLVAENIWL